MCCSARRCSHGKVYLQFEPQFDSIVPVEAWARKLAAKDGFYALWADSKSDLDNVLLTDVQHAAKVSLREYDPVDAATGRVWVELIVPDGTEGPSVGATGRLWRLAIVEETAAPQP